MKLRTLCLAALLVVLAGCSRTRVAHLPIAPRAATVDADDGDEVENEAEAAEWYLQRRLPLGATEIPAERYRAAREQFARAPRPAAASGLNWLALGPGNIGSRTRSLIIDPSNTSVLYAGAVTGGVWKSIDAGKTWNVLTDGLPNINIGALAFDPANSNTIFAGTGEQFDSRIGAGIFKSTDAGATWTQLPGTTVLPAFRYVNRLAISPRNSQQMYAATGAGLYASRDGGATWQAAAVSAAYYGCQDVVIRTDTLNDNVFAACSGVNSASTFAIWRNTDAAGGGAWSQVFTAPNMGRTVIALAPSQQSTIYAAAAGSPNSPRDGVGLAGVFRSTSNGDSGSWTTQVSGNSSNLFDTLLFSGVGGSAGSYCSGGAKGSDYSTWSKLIAVDPLDANRVWVGGVDLFRSDDGGVSWGVVSRWDIAGAAAGHADRHLLVFAPDYDGAANQTLYQANDGGIFRTTNARAAVSTGPLAGCTANYNSGVKVTWTHLDSGFVGTQFYHGAAYPGGATYFGGAQDNGVSRGWDQAGVNGWASTGGGDGGAVGVDPADANRLYQTAQQLSFQRSVNGGTFTSAVGGITEASSTFPFEAYMAMDPNEGRRLYLGGTTTLWRSVDGAISWQAAAPVEANSFVSTIAVSPFDSNTVFFGTRQGVIYSNSAALTSNGSTQWTSRQPRTGLVSSIAFDPANPNVMYATYSNLKSKSTDAHVYRSNDAGVTWTPADGAAPNSVPDIAAWRLLVDPRIPSTLYLGTDLGLLYSQNGGTTWTKDPGLPPVYIEDMGFDSVTQPNWLFAYTFGRGMFKAALPGIAVPGCAYSVNPTSVSIDRFGGTFPISVNTAPGCPWTALPGSSPTAFQFQSPAQGNGSGTAYLVIPPNIDTSATATDTVAVAGQPIPVTRSGQAFQNLSNDHSATAQSIGVPAMIRADTRSLTSDADDPVHSCSGAADFKTVWWSVTPSASGYLNAMVRGDRLDVFGDSGIVVTAYAKNAPGVELACATLPRNSNARTTTSINFPITAGETYLIEISAIGNTAQDGGNATLVLTQGAAPVSVAITPSGPTLSAGAALQFSAQVSNSPNGSVRWSVTPPLGRISPTGLYTAPVSIGSPASVTITATAFSDPSKSVSTNVQLSNVAPAAPVITSVGNAASGAAVIAQNTWVAISGANLSVNTRLWGDADFVNGSMPTQLDGVRATVNGKPAFIYYISPAQVNVLTPLDDATGPVQITLSYGAATSAAVTVNMAPYSPAFFQFSGVPHVAATHAPGNLLGPTSLYAGLTTPAQPGETVVIYAAGFGPTQPPLVGGSATQAAELPRPWPTVTIAGQPATVSFAGVVSPGLYQLNVVVPTATPDGDAAIAASYRGVSTQTGAVIAVKR